jgi:hypothetical protein
MEYFLAPQADRLALSRTKNLGSSPSGFPLFPLDELDYEPMDPPSRGVAHTLKLVFGVPCSGAFSNS